MTASRFLAALALLCAAAPATAQAPARYLVQSDTLRYTTDNPFRLYWMRGADTIGPPRRTRAVEAHAWRGTPERPEAVVRQVTLDLERKTRVDTFSISPFGKLEAINHQPPLLESRIDVLPRLPGTVLRVGVAWSDTVRSSGTGPAGPQWYEVARSYRVSRILDTLDASGVAELEATGQVRFRLGFWADSAAGRVAWIDVAGPIHERSLFDVRHGRLLRQQWSMDLRGRGVPLEGTDTVPAGLISSNTMMLAESPRTRFLLAPLAGADTAVTFNTDTDAAALLHVVQRSPNRVVASMMRGDGTLGVVTATYKDGRTRSYEATWADSAGALRSRRITERAGSLLLRSPGARDTTIAHPAGSWAIADYGMSELLVPELMALPRDGVAHPISIFRPAPARWDTGTAVVRATAGLVVVNLEFPNDERELMIVTPEGDYLFGQQTGTGRSTRLPVNRARMARLEATIKQLNAPSTAQPRTDR